MALLAIYFLTLENRYSNFYDKIEEQLLLTLMKKNRGNVLLTKGKVNCVICRF